MKTKLTWILVGIAALGLHAGLAAAAEEKDAMVPQGKPPQVPEECLEPNLSPEIQRFCDQLRFADVPHYHVVRHASNGAVRAVRLIETVTGREVITSYPHGIKFAAPDQDDGELRIRTTELQGVLEGRPTPAPAAAAPAGLATGLPIGWNSSTGPTPGQCLNYTIAPLSNNVQHASFNSQNTASSTAEQINVSATVNVAFDFFQASDTFSFSDQWQSSTNSTSQYYNFFSIYTLNATVPTSNPPGPLNDEGQAHQSDGSFNTLCGSDYMASVPVGMLATLSINYGSTSSSTLTTISNTLTASFGLDSISTAVSTASEDTNSSSYFTFSMQTYGGGTQATTALNNAFAAEDPQTHEAFYALCAQGNANACTQFTSSLGTGATNALNAFNAQVTGLNSATNPDLSFLQTFPHGVAGANTSTLVTSPIPFSTTEILAPYKTQLEDFVKLLNEISTLRNRVRGLEGLFAAEPSLNLAVILDIVSYLNRLDNIYTGDRTTLLKQLAKCLEATSTSVDQDCKPISDNQATTAFAYYGSGTQTDFFAQQNTLALQYTGLDQVTGGPPVPQDVIYIDELPSFAAVGGNPIAGEAGFVNFIDRPFTTPTGTFLDPGYDILALEPNQPLSTNNVSTTVRANPAASSPFTLWTFLLEQGPRSVSRPGTTFSSASCTPTPANPCAINYFTPSISLSVEHRQIEDFFTAD